MNIAVKCVQILMSLVYVVIKGLTPVKANKITLISRQSDAPSLDFELLDKELKNRNIRTAVLTKTLNKSPAKLFSYGFHMLRQMYHIAGSRILILDGYCVVASMMKHKKELSIIQIWHSMGTMKDFGYSAMGKEEGSSYRLAKTMKMHCNYDYVLISSDAYKDDMAAGFNCSPDIIYTHPLPRLDLLTGTEYSGRIRNKIFMNYRELEKKKNILYCPTFRKNDESELQQAVNSLIGKIDYNKYNLIVKLHPLSKIVIKNNNVITADDFTTFDMIFVADYVISDYSCVIYEAAVRHIPLYFYCFDFAQYEENRGLAIDYKKECPGVISDNPENIIRAIESEAYDMEYLEEFADKYVCPTKTATADMADFILKVMK